MLLESYTFPFEKGKPSIFTIVGSPFQALCAIEAIKDLEIQDYKFFVCLGNSIRDGQALALLNKYNIKYNCYKLSDILSLKGRLSILRFRYNKYKRVFVGDFRSLQSHYCALLFASNKSTIISLDDGNCNVSLLRNVYKLRVNKKVRLLSYWYFNAVAKLRHIQKDRYLYTLFSDIPNKTILCCPNHFKNIQLFPNTDYKRLEGVFFVGTNTCSFSDALSIQPESFYKFMEFIFEGIKKEHVNETTIFIPHGADDDSRVKQLCQEYDFKYERPDTLIELYLLDQNCPPKTVYGFTSTALFTIKKMFPQTEVINILFIGNYPNYERRKSISDYYALHDIKTIAIDINGQHVV